MNKSAILTLVSIYLLYMGMVVVQPVKADFRTLVVPDDYETIGEAVGNATDGDLVFVKSGTYQESMLVINKSISLIGENATRTKVYLNPPFINVTIFTVTFEMRDGSIKINANDFKLSGFTFFSLGGISSIAGDRLEIIGNTIPTGLTVSGSCSTIADNTITGGKFELSGSNNTIKGNTLDVSGTPAASCKGSYNLILENNATGSSSFYVEGYSNVLFNNTINFGYGLDLDGTENIIAKNNLTSLIVLGSNNTAYANEITSGMTIWCKNSVFYANHISLIYPIVWSNSGNNLFYHNNFEGNIKFREDQEITPYYWDNGKEGNYWSGYLGFDGNGDGIGDVPFIIDANTTDRYPLMKPFDISAITIELPKWVDDAVFSQPSASSILPSPTASTSPSFGIQPQEPNPFPTALMAGVLGVTAIILVSVNLFYYIKNKTRNFV